LRTLDDETTMHWNFTKHDPGGSVNKSELIDAIADGAGISKSQAESALNAMIDAVQGAVAGGDKVTLPGFGSWSQSQRSDASRSEPSNR
jgi:DNA-binding protein HU-beta